jgi:hypothetical protein
MTKETRNPSCEIVGRLCQSRKRSGFAFVPSAKGAVFIASLGQRPRVGEKTNISAEGAIHFPPSQLTTRTDLIRTFSACLLGIQIPRAMPQADNDIAPLAPNAHRSAEWSRREQSDIDGQVARPSERERASQTAYNHSGFVINSSFVIRASSFSCHESRAN